MLIWGTSGMCLSMVLLATLLYFPSATGDAGRYMDAGSLFLFMGFFEMSLGPVLWLLLSELYPLEVRGHTLRPSDVSCSLFCRFVVWRCQL
jgi:hypothetical protein